MRTIRSSEQAVTHRFDWNHLNAAGAERPVAQLSRSKAAKLRVTMSPNQHSSPRSSRVVGLILAVFAVAAPFTPRAHAQTSSPIRCTVHGFLADLDLSTIVLKLPTNSPARGRLFAYLDSHLRGPALAAAEISIPQRDFQALGQLATNAVDKAMRSSARLVRIRYEGDATIHFAACDVEIGGPGLWITSYCCRIGAGSWWSIGSSSSRACPGPR